METRKDTQIKVDRSDNDSSFEQEISENDSNKSFSNFESKNKFMKEESESIFRDKNLEEAEINDIYDLLNKIELEITLDKSILDNKDDYYIKNRRRSYSFEIKKNKKNEKQLNECEEILSILKKPLSDKNLKDKNIFNFPFKPLLEPKKVSLVGKVIYDITSENYTVESSSENY